MFKEIIIESRNLKLNGHQYYNNNAKAWVIFAHGSGSSRKSYRNNWVAQQLVKHGFGALLFDLLTEEEDVSYQNRFNIPLLSQRLLLATQWLVKSKDYKGEEIAYFGASTGAAAALEAVARAPMHFPIYTVISRGGRPDLAHQEALLSISIPVLLIVGDRDDEVVDLNRQTENFLKNVKLSLIPGATHLFEEPGTLDQVVDLAVEWLDGKLPFHKHDDSVFHL